MYWWGRSMMGDIGTWSLGSFAWPWMGWILPLALLDVILKAFALWRSARAGQKWWFVALILLNTAGILPVIYLLTHPPQKTKKK